MFQSTRPRGARHWTQQGRRKMLYVSIHAPAWGATRPTPPILQPAWFQSTRPRGARPKASSIILTHSSFNPRARVGRDLQARLQSCACVCRFNPRARVGRDTPSGANCVSLNSFNPRARVGRDFDACASGEDALVSIHAPAWGATVSHRRHTSLYARFNPRARVGRDLSRWPTNLQAGGFNPRARVGRDRYNINFAHEVGEFQSTRPRGARRHV